MNTLTEALPASSDFPILRDRTQETFPDSKPRLEQRYLNVRNFSEKLCETLEPEDYVIQTMPEASPTKWHMAHTSWFFETFVLKQFVPGYDSPYPQYAFLFNSYYNAVGPFYSRPQRVLTGTTVQRVQRQRDGGTGIALSLSRGQTVFADEVLVATGRQPRTGDLGLETVGLKPGSWLEVDDTMRVKGVPGNWLYAAGDVNHRALLTHMGKYQARVCGDVIAARAKDKLEASAPDPWTKYAATADSWAVPQVIFSDPEVAAVGLTEAEAKARGINARVVDYDIGNVIGAALYADGYKGHARMVIDQARGVVVGVTLVGPSVGELIHAATIAIVGAVPISRLWHAVPSYPTISEVWLRLLEGLGL